MSKSMTRKYGMDAVLAFGGCANGEGSGGGGQLQTDDPAAADTQQQAAAPKQQDKGYPDGVAVDDMTPQQQAAYWKSHARRWEGRAKAFDGLTPEELDALRDKAGKHDALEHELLSDKDKAVSEARKAGESETSAKYLPRLVAAEIRAAAAGRTNVDEVTAALEFADLSKFTNGKGDVDSDAIARFVDARWPQQQRPTGPSTFGVGTRQSTSTPGAAGLAMAEKRFGKKS